MLGILSLVSTINNIISIIIDVSIKKNAITELKLLSTSLPIIEMKNYIKYFYFQVFK